MKLTFLLAFTLIVGARGFVGGLVDEPLDFEEDELDEVLPEQEDEPDKPADVLEPTTKPPKKPWMFPTGWAFTLPTGQPAQKKGREKRPRPTGQPGPSGIPKKRRAPMTGRPKQIGPSPSGKPPKHPTIIMKPRMGPRPLKKLRPRPTGQPSKRPTGRVCTCRCLFPRGRPDNLPSRRPKPPTGMRRREPRPSGKPVPSGKPKKRPTIVIKPRGHMGPSLGKKLRPRPTGQPSVRPTGRVCTCRCLFPRGRPEKLPSRRPNPPTGMRQGNKPRMLETSHGFWIYRR